MAFGLDEDEPKRKWVEEVAKRKKQRRKHEN